MPAFGVKRLPLLSAGIALVCALLACAPSSIAGWLEYDRRAILAGELWRLWTCHLVHFSIQHMLADACALLLVGGVAESMIGARRLTAVLLLGAPAISVGLMLTTPAMEHFRGASALSVMLGVVGGAVLWRAAPDLRPLIVLGGGVLGAKIALEAAGLMLTLSGLPDGVHIAWQAHFLALAVGASWGVIDRRFVPRALATQRANTATS